MPSKETTVGSKQIVNQRKIKERGESYSYQKGAAVRQPTVDICVQNKNKNVNKTDCEQKIM